jgi:kinesin family protein 5
VFPPTASQEEVFEIAAKPIVESVLQGFNGTVFAYGQTSSGKTFTMTGPDIDDPELMGIIPRMVGTVFSDIGNSSDNLEYTVKIGYCEIYMEKIKDLLNPIQNNLKIKEDRNRGVYIDELTEEYVSQEDEVYDLMKIGTSNREVGATNMNQGSSRSHSIFMLTVTQNNLKDYSAKTGKLYLVDLAGSEKVSKTGAEGKRLDEAKNINKSLTTLGMVIYALTDGKSTHVPYRDSKLTRVLQDSLGGNSKTSLIITCSPSPYNDQETLSTLRFGVRAKSIKNKPKVNRDYTVVELKMMLAKAQEQLLFKDKRISELESQFKKAGKQLPISLLEDEEANAFQRAEGVQDIMTELETTRERLQEEMAQNAYLQDRLNERSSMNGTLDDENREMRMILNVLTDRLQQLEDTLQQKEDSYDRLNSIQEALQQDYENLVKDKQKLEQKLLEKEAEHEQLASNIQLSSKNSQEIMSMVAKFKLLSDKNIKLQEEVNSQAEKIASLEGIIDNLRQQLTQSLSSQLDVNSIRATIEEEITQRERKKWDIERVSITKDLHNRIDRVLKLEQEVDNLVERNKRLEAMIPQPKQALTTKIEELTIRSEEITNQLNKLSSQKAMMKVDIQVNERKMQKLNDKCNNLELQLKLARDQILSLEEDKVELQEKVSNFLRQNRTTMNLSKIKKPIRGGFSNRRNTSNFKISSTFCMEAYYIDDD